MVIKWSLGGESAGGWRSTSKSTCVVPAWTLTSENASLGVSASQWRNQLTFDPKRCLLFWKCMQWSLACMGLSESSFSAIQEGVWVCHGRPVGLHARVPLVVCVYSISHWFQADVLQRATLSNYRKTPSISTYVFLRLAMVQVLFGGGGGGGVW